MTSDYTPRKNIPFHAVIKEICGCEVLAISPTEQEDKALLDSLSLAGVRAKDLVVKAPIWAKRPNEAGNKMEKYVKDALGKIEDIKVQNMSRHKGYPDIKILYKESKICYIECKTYSKENSKSSLRSFFFSPSLKSEITKDAYHFVFSYEMKETGRKKVEKKVEKKEYMPVKFTMVDLRELPCDLKYEWNSNNPKLYAAERILKTYDFS